MTFFPRGSLPMVLPPAPFALIDVVACAKLVDIAYEQYNQWVKKGRPSKAAFHWSKPTGHFYYSEPLTWTSISNHDEPFGFVAVDTQSRDAYLVFRGTATKADEVQDAEAFQASYQFVPGYGQVHAGFQAIYAQLQPQIHSGIAAAAAAVTPFRRFLFTGHSLGAALSTLAVPDVIANVPVKLGPPLSYLHLNLASPRVGDARFAYMMNNNGVPSYRIVNTEDVVPDAPPAILEFLGQTYLYKHIGTPVDFTAQYDSDIDNHSLDIAYEYAIAHPANPEGPLVIQPIRLARLPGMRLAPDGSVMRQNSTP